MTPKKNLHNNNNNHSSLGGNARSPVKEVNQCTGHFPLKGAMYLHIPNPTLPIPDFPRLAVQDTTSWTYGQPWT